MDKKLEEKCKEFIENRDALNSFFKLELTTNISVGAIMYMQENKKVDIDTIKECYNVLKQNANVFSDYRNELCIPLVIKMSLSENPLDYFNKVIEISKRIKSMQKGFVLNVANVISAIVLNENAKEKEIEKIIEKSNNLFTMIKKEHPFLTSDDDRTDAIIMAMSEKSEEELIKDVEECYKFLVNKKIGSKGRIQTLSHVLALSKKTVEEKCNRIIEIYDLLKEKKIKFETEADFAIAMLGAFADIEIDNETIVNKITEIYEYLQSIKGLGKLSISKSERFVYSAIIFLNSSEGNGFKSALSTQIVTALAVYTTLNGIVAASAIVWMD